MTDRFPPVETLLPHGAAMRFIHRILECDNAFLTCFASVPASNPFSRGGRVPAFVALEVAAQAAGLHWAIRHRIESPDTCLVGRGYLVNVKEATFASRSFEADQELAVRVEIEGLAPPLSSFRFSIAPGGGPWGHGHVSLFAEPGP